MWRSLVLASLFQGASLGADRAHQLSTPDAIDALANSFSSPAPLSRALDARIHSLQVAPSATLAAETLQVMSPLAERAGLASLRSDLDDLSFHVLSPAIHEALSHGADERARVAGTLAQHATNLMQGLSVTGEVSHRTKSAYSTWRKMERKGLTVDQVLDRVALRLVVDTEASVYALLGALHERYTPLDDAFDDDIAQPKPNGYQSIHTAVHVDGQVAEFQLRTYAMHEAAEQGDAAHWRYKLVG